MREREKKGNRELDRHTQLFVKATHSSSSTTTLSYLARDAARPAR